MLTAGLAVLAVFVVFQLRASDPLVQVRLPAKRAFLGDVLVLFGTQFRMLAMTLYAALYSQNLLGYSPMRAGCSSLAMIIPLMAGAQIAGRRYNAAGARRPLLTGLALATVGAVVWAAGFWVAAAAFLAALAAAAVLTAARVGARGCGRRPVGRAAARLRPPHQPIG